MVELISLGNNYVPGKTVDVNGVLSEAITVNNKKLRIELKITGDSGDSDELEIWLRESIGENTFETIGINFANITLTSTTQIIKVFTVAPVTSKCKLFLKMEAASTETPEVIVNYTLTDE